MSQKVISLRISSALLDRLDQMVELLKGDLKRSPRGNLTRAEVLRESIIRGCDLMESESRKAFLDHGSPEPATVGRHVWHKPDVETGRMRDRDSTLPTQWHYHAAAGKRGQLDTTEFEPF
jgi:hypothetical protein